MGHGFDLFLEVSVNGSRRDAIEQAIRSAIRAGTLVSHTRLPSTRDLAIQLGMARGTVGAAYSQLIAEGWLCSATGKGTWVAERAHANGSAGTGRGWVPTTEPVRHDLRPGRPDASAFPRRAWARAMDKVIRAAPADAFGYGDPRGRLELRTALAAYLGRVRGVRVDPKHLVICSGYTQALHLLTQVFAELGAQTAAMENPAMPDHVAIVGARLRVTDVPVDGGGMVADAIDDSVSVTVCTPAHQFPLGVRMSAQRRERLLAKARDHGMWIVEDDYDGEFRYDRKPIGAMQASLPTQVAYVGSTSKSLGPAVRVGWIACPPALLDPVVEAKRLADRQTSPLDQLALAELIDSGGHDRHLRAARLAYRRRRDALVRAVATRLPGATMAGVAAGLHAVLLAPPELGTEADLASRLRSRSVRVHLLGDYLRGTRPDRPSLVIGYATPAEHGYAAAVTMLLDALTGVGQRHDNS